MKIGIVSDTHSNLHALESVLEHMNSIGVDEKVHLGDIVGLGPKPSETLELTLEEFNYIAIGNHDLAVVDEEYGYGFSPQARFAVDWTREKMKKTEIEVLANLADSHSINDLLFIHGSPQRGGKFNSIEDLLDVNKAFEDPVKDFNIAFVGNTHVPMIWDLAGFVRPNFNSRDDKGVSSFSATFSGTYPLKNIINVGSVGQVRDGDNRASYCIYDTDKCKVTFYKVPYAIERTIGLMQRAGFSENAYQRLMYGR